MAASSTTRQQHTPATILGAKNRTTTSTTTTLDTLLSRTIASRANLSRSRSSTSSTSPSSSPTDRQSPSSTPPSTAPSTEPPSPTRRRHAHRRHSQALWLDIDSPSPSTYSALSDDNVNFKPNMQWRDLLPSPTTSTREEIWELLFATLFSAVAVVMLSCLFVKGVVQIGLGMLVVGMHGVGLVGVWYCWGVYQSVLEVEGNKGEGEGEMGGEREREVVARAWRERLERE